MIGLHIVGTPTTVEPRQDKLDEVLAFVFGDASPASSRLERSVRPMRNKLCQSCRCSSIASFLPLTRSWVVGRKRPSSLAGFRPTIEGRSECRGQPRLQTTASGFPSRRN
jgi:hypothetical protein